MSSLPATAAEMAWIGEGDESLDPNFPGINVVLNRARMAAFLRQFGCDRDLRDLLALDVLVTLAGLPLSSTGAAEAVPMPSLVSRPFRLWEYAWLYKVLGLSAGGYEVLDLGGPATHLSVLASLAGCRVTAIDLNASFVEAAKYCADALQLQTLQPLVGDMQDLSRFSEGQFDVVLSCSVLEHLTAEGQEQALQQIARVLKPGGIVGLTFDYGPGAPGANEFLPPPHEPPPSAAEAVRRYSQNGLHVVGNKFEENPEPGSLFRDNVVRYTAAALFLAKESEPNLAVPKCETFGSALGRFALPDLPLRLYSGLSRVRNQLLRVPMLEEGLAATEAARAKLAEDVARLEAESPIGYMARRYARWKQRR